MAKLHELLAAENPLKSQAVQVRSDLITTFEKKRHLFGRKIVTFTPSADGAQMVTEEQSDLQSTVKKELAWIKGLWAKALDAAYQVAETNTKARADVIIDDGTILLKDVPATALLELEKRADEIHILVSSIPTLDPPKGSPSTPQRELASTRPVKSPRAAPRRSSGPSSSTRPRTSIRRKSN
jgi:hypothetical protein